nr:transcriptional activator protein acu-15 [Quercus suber]
MPGILPMKVIKVGLNSQARIAQACDRLRTESAFWKPETRELKDLLDEKDEKIDMLSRMHSRSSLPKQLPSPRRTSTDVSEPSPLEGKDQSPEKDETFKVQQFPYLLNATEGSDSYFAGTSSGRTFIEAFRHALQEKGRSMEDICIEKLLTPSSWQEMPESEPAPPENNACKAPPRLVSDRLINIFFQEWAPLFPVLHRPTFLVLYERYVNNSETVTDLAELALLNLVFGIASLSNGSRSSSDLRGFERQWKSAIDGILNENGMPTLQALLLAQIFCVQQGDLKRLLTYKGLSTTLSARLGLHQSQKRFALDALTCETRKKVFWTLYTIDSFTAVMLGLPKHIQDDDIQCEYPVDADDEYVSERGFQPSLPGEFTKLSSALALFRLARILSRVLKEVFPAKSSYDLSLSTISNLSDELDAWNIALAPHLRLQFVQDKPSTGTISSRSPLLSLAYHYTRALLHRPAVCASNENRYSSSIIALASSSKHVIQITQLLEERGMCFASCINKDELLVLSALGLMLQSMKLDPASKILKDNQKMVRTVTELLHKSEAPCADEFERVVAIFMPSSATMEPSSQLESLTRSSTELSPQDSHTAIAVSERSMACPPSGTKQLTADASYSTTIHDLPQLDATDGNRTMVHKTSLVPRAATSQDSRSLPPVDFPRVGATISRRRRSSTAARPLKPSLLKQYLTPSPRQQHKVLNLDYLSFGEEQETNETKDRPVQPVKPESKPTDWEKLLGSLDNGTTNIYDACYGGLPIEALADTPSPPQISTETPPSTRSEDPASTRISDSWAFNPVDTDTTVDSAYTAHYEQADSVLSFSSDDFAASFTDNTTADDGATYAEWLSALETSIIDLTSCSTIP